MIYNDRMNPFGFTKKAQAAAIFGTLSINSNIDIIDDIVSIHSISLEQLDKISASLFGTFGIYGSLTYYLYNY